MLVCPKCNAKYKKSLIKRRIFCDCNTKLANVFTIEDAKVHVLATPYGNADLWAKSTLPESAESEQELVEVYRVKAGMWNTCPRERMWLHDVLDDRGIGYKVEITGEYPMQAGGFRRSRKFKEVQIVYVEKSMERRVIRLIKKFNNPQKVEFGEAAATEGKEVFDINNMPQTTCPNCGKKCDTDYSKCPFCKKALY
jgi:hypothetical protein